MDEMRELRLFVAAASHGGFRKAATRISVPASTISEAVRRLEERLGVRLLNRTTRSVALTEAGARLLDRIVPALGHVDAALDAAVGAGGGPGGALRLNVPAAVMRTVLPPILDGFQAMHPDVSLDIVVDSALVDVFGTGADAGIRYGETLEQDVIAIPIGPRAQRLAAVAAPSYIDSRGQPSHPRDLLDHDCIRTRFPSGALIPWSFASAGEQITLDPPGQITVSTQAIDYAMACAIAGRGILMTFEDWLAPHVKDGSLVPVLPDWWPSFEGPYLYYPGRDYLPRALRAFVDFVKARPRETGNPAA